MSRSDTRSRAARGAALRRAAPVALALLVAACQTGPRADPVPSGRALYEAHCASCHGATGRGDGPLAAQLARRPTDLTARTDLDEPLSSLQIMAVAHGADRAGTPDEVMPAFGTVLDGPLVPYDSGDGIATPTPLPLVRVAEYVRSLAAARDGTSRREEPLTD